jgi:hypothetical protein
MRQRLRRLAPPVSGGRREHALAYGPAQEEGHVGHLAGPKEKEGSGLMDLREQGGRLAGWAKTKE